MITIVLPISRSDYLRPVFKCLDDLIRPENTELLIITDGNKDLQEAVTRRLGTVNFAHTQVINFGDNPGEDINSRRYRISAIHNLASTYVPRDCEYVFLLEDDTTYPPNALTKLLKAFNSKYVGFASGLQLGRHNTPYIGAWCVDDVDNPKNISSIMPSAGVEMIDAGGFYCALVLAKLYRNHNFEPFDKRGTNGLSCDVNFGLRIRREGYTCLADHSIQCDHIGVRGAVNLGNTKPRKVMFEKHNGKWSAKTVI